MSGKRIPVHILTGFLGSGKSTLLSALLHAPGMDRTAVIVNEFGEVGLDHLLVAEGGEDTVLLDSGCLCCLGNSQIQDTLMLLRARAKRGEIPEFDRVLVETSGLADPAPLLQPLLADPFIGRAFQLGRVVTVVDAEYGEAQAANHVEARKQIAVADRIIVSKIDIAAQQHVNATRRSIRSLNAMANIVESKLPISDVEKIFALDDRGQNTSVFDSVKEKIAAAQGSDGPGTPNESAHIHEHAHDHHHSHSHDHSDGIRSRVLRPPTAVDWQTYADWLRALRRLDGEKLLRTKGMLSFSGEGMKVIQGVQHTFSTPADFRGASVTPFVVMIVRDISEAELAESDRILGHSPAEG